MDGNNIHPKHSNMAAIAGIFGLFILIGVFILFSPDSTKQKVSPAAEQNRENQDSEPSRELVNYGDVAKEQEPTPTTAGPSMPQNVEDPSNAQGITIKSNYVTYTPSTLDTILEDQGRALLFFHASWCPTCRAADKSIQTDGDQLPQNLTILKVDYDTETDLKRKYNVTYQHMFVLVDSNMNEITKWQGGGVETILENLNNSL